MGQSVDHFGQDRGKIRPARRVRHDDDGVGAVPRRQRQRRTRDGPVEGLPHDPLWLPGCRRRRLQGSNPEAAQVESEVTASPWQPRDHRGTIPSEERRWAMVRRLDHDERCVLLKLA